MNPSDDCPEGPPRPGREALQFRLGGRVLAGALVVFAVFGCADAGPEPSYDGAVWIELACVEEGRAPDASELERLLEALSESYGGEDAWRELSFVTVEDVYLKNSNDIMSNQGVRQIFCRPDAMFRCVLEQRSGQQQRLLQDGEPWFSVMGGELAETVGDNHVAIWWEYKSYRLPDILRRPDSRLEAMSPVELDGRWTIPVKVADGERPELIVYIDPSGPVIRRIEATVPISAMVHGGGLIRELSKDFSLFRRHGDFLIAERTDVYDGETRVLLAEVRRFERATSIDDSIFSPASPAPSLPR